MVNILVNDGGAPARIMKVGNALTDLTAGMIVGLDNAGKVLAENTNLPANSEAIGVLFVDATSGDPASVLTGSGIICFLKANADAIACGDALSHDAAGLAITVDSAAVDRFAVALEARSATHTDYVKALVK